MARESFTTGMGEGAVPTWGEAQVRWGVGRMLKKEWSGECGESRGQGFQIEVGDRGREKTGRGFQEASWTLVKCWGLPLSWEPLEEFEHGSSVICSHLCVVPRAACGEKKEVVGVGQNRGRGRSVIQLTRDSGLVQGASQRDGEKWPNSGYTLKRELTDKMWDTQRAEKSRMTVKFGA